jgi:hypothetical protein
LYSFWQQRVQSTTVERSSLIHLCIFILPAGMPGV